MALLTNSQNTYAQIGIKEDLQDMVYRIDPEETPFQSNINTSARVTQTMHEWQTQALATASKTNFQLEGDDSVSAAAVTNRVRIKNYCAISKKTFAVSGTGNAVSIAGVSNELEEQTLLRGIELKRDMELILLDNNAYEPGGTTTARECAGLLAYITNSNFTGTGLSSTTAPLGTGADTWALLSISAQGLNLTILRGAMQEAYTDGGAPNLLMLSPTQKKSFSLLALGTAAAVQLRTNVTDAGSVTLIGAVEAWRSDFGAVQVAVNRQLAGDTTAGSGLNGIGYLIDTRYASVGYLRPMTEEDLAKTGDNTKRHILAEYTLIVGAPKAHAMVGPLTQ